jgi:hypothetical protein
MASYAVAAAESAQGVSRNFGLLFGIYFQTLYIYIYLLYAPLRAIG